MEAFRYNLEQLRKKIQARINKSKTSKEKLWQFIEFYEAEYENIINNGGCPILNTAVDADDGYDFAIIESAPTTLEEFWIKYPFAYKVLKILYLILPKYKKKINMLERFNEIKNLKSILLIYSQKDKITPVSMAEKFMSKSTIPIELYTVDNAKHANIIGSPHKKEYLDKVIN